MVRSTSNAPSSSTPFEHGQDHQLLGHLLVQVHNKGQPTLVRRSRRTRATHKELGGGGGGTIRQGQDAARLSNYKAASRIQRRHTDRCSNGLASVSKVQHEGGVDEKEGNIKLTTKAKSKRRRVSIHANIKPESDLQDNIALGLSAITPPPPPPPPDPPVSLAPEPSLFPSLALKLHGLAADRTGSFYGLVQEILTPDVFGMLVVTILLNQTTGRAAIPVFYTIMYKWPTPRLLAKADEDDLRELLRPIGLFNVRTKRLKEVGRIWCQSPPQWGVKYKSRVVMAAAARQHDEEQRERKESAVYPPTEISHLPGAGRYALDSYLLFRPSPTHPSIASVQIDLCRTSSSNHGGGDGNTNGNEQGKNTGIWNAKPTSAAWQSILDRRVEVGERREVGELLPPSETPSQMDVNANVVTALISLSPSSPPPPYVDPEREWRDVDALDKELKAYMQWRVGRDGDADQRKRRREQRRWRAKVQRKEVQGK